MSQVLRHGGFIAGVVLAGLVVQGLLLWNAPETRTGVERLGRIAWTSDLDGFGGLSGLIVRDGGNQIWAVSDKGTLFAARIMRDAGGRISGFGPVTPHVLHDTKGAPPREFLENAEALASDGADGVFVAYEGWARIWHYPQLDGLPVWTHPWDRFWDGLGNTGFEALARYATGRLLVISERVETGPAAFPALTHETKGWEPAFVIPQYDGFLISGADFGPDGALYILERRFRWYQGFATRIRRLELKGNTIVSDQRLLDSPAWRLGNSEGISVWQSASGQMIISVISDDNFNWWQKTAITEFVID